MSIFNFFKKKRQIPNHNITISIPKDESIETFDIDISEFCEPTDDFRDQSFGINYINGKGIKSSRWITVIRIYSEESFYAQCESSGRFRQFRFDRVDSIFDGNGEIHDPAQFFGYFDIYVPNFIPPKRKYGKALKAYRRDEVKVLTALCRIDGYLHPGQNH